MYPLRLSGCRETLTIERSGFCRAVLSFQANLESAARRVLAILVLTDGIERVSIWHATVNGATCIQATTRPCVPTLPPDKIGSSLLELA